MAALRLGLNVDCGLHTYLGDDPEMVRLAAEHGAVIRDIRRPKPTSELHFFTGKIGEVTSLKVALLGTDSAVGKRTTAWVLVDALREAGITAEMIGTGQTTWLQGARYSIIFDSLINDFVSGEIEHVVWEAWRETGADVLVLEGQGSLLNPAYPGGFELLAAGRPDVVIMQHPPARREYDGFPGWPLHPLDVQIRAVELIGGKPVVTVDDRRAVFRAAFGDRFRDVRLGELLTGSTSQLRERIGAADILAVFSTQIDDFGEHSDPLVAWRWALANF